MTSSASGSRPDRCPGVFATHSAADGELARIRVPGGAIGATALESLAAAAEDYGDGGIEITVRGNLQVRGIAVDEVADFASAVTDAGLVSDASHDRVRNITMSPFTGRVGGLVDLRPVAEDLHARLVERPWSAELSGRFWFGLDDGHGDVLVRGTDVAGVAVDPADAVVVVGDRVVSDRMPCSDLADGMVAAAAAFAEVADGAWRVADLDSARMDALTERLAAAVGVGGVRPTGRHPEPRVGWFSQADGRVMLGAVVPFGRLTVEQARYAAAIGTPITVTPEREILIGDLDDAVADTVVRVLAPLGFVFDARSPWTSLTACTGTPGCGKSSADVRGDLGAYVAGLDPAADAPDRQHWIGCSRGCGSPARAHVRVLASSDGYVREHRT